jgi:hypothetical protein
MSKSAVDDCWAVPSTSGGHAPVDKQAHISGKQVSPMVSVPINREVGSKDGAPPSRKAGKPAGVGKAK